MITREELDEIKNRDFLDKRNHFSQHDDVKSEKILGDFYEESPLVTIVMPIYNHPAPYFERALKSAIEQKGFSDYQVLIVDNDAEAKNGNEEIVHKLSSSKVVYFRNEKNIGLFGNWSRACLLAQSKWITYLHSDDMLKENFLATMCPIILQHSEIDQLASSSVNFDSDEFDESVLTGLKGAENRKHLLVKKVSVSEYYDGMATSVKGALMKRDCLLDIGGFRDFGQGLGLSDYTAMLKYAYYYNTYHVGFLSYLNGWGKNDSLNLSLWYPEMVANYHMQMFFNKKGNYLIRYLNKCKYTSILYRQAQQYNSGRNFSGKVIPVDMEQMERDCEIKRTPNLLYYKLIRKCVNGAKNLWLQIGQEKFYI